MSDLFANSVFNVSTVPMFNGGYFCNQCSTWVFGNSHVCMAQWVCPVPQLRPHKCPVCDGRGRVSFDPERALPAIETPPEGWPCKPCNGGGVLWGF